MASASKNVTSQSSDGEAFEVKAVAVQSEAIKNMNKDDCAAYGDGIPIPNVFKKIILNSSDGEVFEVEQAVAVQSEMIKNMIEDDCTENGIPIPNVTGKILSKVLEYCNKHVDGKKYNSMEKEFADLVWDAEFAKNLDQTTLYDLRLAANFLNIKNLLDLLCQKVADMIRGKMPDEIRKIFNIKNDLTPEEEENIISEHAWAFQEAMIK